MLSQRPAIKKLTEMQHLAFYHGALFLTAPMLSNPVSAVVRKMMVKRS
jgi:hypothetical protein